MAQCNLPVEGEFVVSFDPSPQSERRTATRYRCRLAALVPLQLTEASTSVEAWGCDLSAKGISLNMPHALDAGTAVVLRLNDQQHTKSVTVMAHVVHSAQEHDGTWRIGCQFDQPLDPETLEILL